MIRLVKPSDGHVKWFRDAIVQQLSERLSGNVLHHHPEKNICLVRVGNLVAWQPHQLVPFEVIEEFCYFRQEMFETAVFAYSYEHECKFLRR
jgi:hypothetical protein